MSNNSASRWKGPPHPGPQRRGLVPLSLLILGLLVALFGLITPSRLPLNIDPGSVALPAPTVAPTAQPRPTDVHGGHIVFTCTRGALNQICMVRADGTNYEQLTAGDSNSYYPAISPDGEHIIFAVNKYDTFDLFRLSPKIVEGGRASESRLKRLTDYVGNAFSPSYSPDGRQVVFVNRVQGHPSALWMMGSDGEDPHAVFSAPADIVGAAWSPDGRYVGFTMASDNAYSYEVYLFDLADASAPPRRVPSALSNLGGSISWSPDQSNLLVFAGPAAAREIYRIEIASGAATQLTFGGNNASPSYSPDGHYIVFNSLRNDGQADLYIMLANGHSMRRLTDYPEPDWQPQWGP